MPESTLTSAYRPQLYQDHIREVWLKDAQLVAGQLNSSVCAAVKENVQMEWNRHTLTAEPAVNSNHKEGTAFDARWTGNVNIDTLAQGCSLSRCVTINGQLDYNHFCR